MAWAFYVLVLLVTLSRSFAEAGLINHPLPVPKDCTGDFCTTKPKGYDQLQSDIDKSIMDVKLHLRMEDRYGPEISKGTYGDDNNCRYEVKITRPYMVKVDSKHLVVAQSSLLNQTITERKCKHTTSSMASESKECFLLDDRSEVATKCIETAANVHIYTYNIGEKKIEKVPINVDVWCSCHVRIAYATK
ncbi:hypothetical protein K1T71_005767 [Dendrolimus kikuchii]|uniref:Uncharacterized protein n=1 Tax=Dendrolimus kikuchii TaxID=765133 RepID=A0ACC1D636_9NEOP|nr:hypothetical protein K1T71_005767 [Dendrolimus kikuchii]